MLGEADEIFEFFRGYFPYYLIFVLPVFIIISPDPIRAAHEFPVYRMQQYDLHGISHGCRSSSINLEARSLTGWGTSRHCVIARFEDITLDKFREIRSRAGGLIIVLPGNISALSQDDKQLMLELEGEILAQEILVPVYFIDWSVDLQVVLKDVVSGSLADDHTVSAAETLVNAVSANGYQLVISANNPAAKTDVSVATLQGKLSGYGIEEKLPTVAIVAYYDSFGAAPELSYGADSNGSGVAMLLEIIRLFSTLYLTSKTHARHNIVFLLSGAGKLNYQGSKRWLEDQLDGLEGSLIQDASFVLCLDTVASENALYFHVSKPPREGSPGALFYQELVAAAAEFSNTTVVDTVHKKINLAEEVLAWEHERYSIRRLPAFTVSSLKSHRDKRRASILDVKGSFKEEHLYINTKIVAEALARHIYNMSGIEVFGEPLEVEKDLLNAMVGFLSSHPRSAQLLLDKNNWLISLLRDYMTRYLSDVKVTYLTPDKREPEFTFYDVTKASVNVYSVKPAVFDLFLTIVIALYLGVVYVVVQNFPKLYTVLCNFSSKKTKSQ